MKLIDVPYESEARIIIPGAGSVSISARRILGMNRRIEVLEESLRWLRSLAKGHHGDQPSHVLLHALTVDIPAGIDRVLAGDSDV